MLNLKEKIYHLNSLHSLKDSLSKIQNIHLKGIQGSFRSFVAAFIHEKMNVPVLYIANDLESAECMRDDMELILGKSGIYYLPAVEFEPYDFMEPNPALVSMRLEATQTMLALDTWVGVATTEGLISALPVPEDFVDNQLYLSTGHEYDFDNLVSFLGNTGFQRIDIVEKVGDFSVRGGLIDIYSWNDEQPIRIEFFGNQIESIRHFDVLSQRSTGTIEEITLLTNFSTNQSYTFIDSYLPENTVLFFEDSTVFHDKTTEWFTTALEKHHLNIMSDIDNQPPHKKYLDSEETGKKLKKYKSVQTDLISTSRETVLDFNIKGHPDFGGSIKKMLDYLAKENKSTPDKQFHIQSLNHAQSSRLREIFEEEDFVFNGQFIFPALHHGFLCPELNLQILTDHEIFNRFKQRKTLKRFRSGEYLRSLSGLRFNDYIVHIDYGIGQYKGMETLSYGTVKKECIKVVYQDGDLLYVTVDRLNRVQKYSSESTGFPRLNKLGGTEWERSKKKTKESLKKIAGELIRIYAGRKAESGFAFAEDNHWQKELEASFIYEETEDQLKSINHVKADMQNPEPMDRLLCGDVGFGKTEVAIRASFKAVMTGKQAAVLAPTTILALQHHQTFKERMSEFPLQIELLNRFRSVKEQKRILADLEVGKVDIIIGTHRLLSEDVKFSDLGLLVIDEEQRFGVRHKEKLKKYRLSVDILSMTATPIPRTLHMALMGARDLSHIDTPPRNRLPVHTEIMHWDEEKLRFIILRELGRKGQVYFVHNRVETIETFKASLQQMVPGARIAVGHGQLPERRLEKVILDFMHHKYDILVASMIIENGLDIPNVNSIIINRADKFGLSQLYQLRGRVGRSNLQAYAYLVVPSLNKITEVARKRLRVILDFTELGSGYKIALRDLEIRGAGNLLGKEQSGFVQSVGFELYCSLLDEAVKEIKQGDEISDKQLEQHSYIDPKIDMDFDLLIPEDYISNELERISIYHRLVNFSEVDQIEQLQEELEDRFGKIPEMVVLFLLTIELKVLASHLYADRIIKNGKKFKMIFSDKSQGDSRFFKQYIPALMNQKMTAVKFINQEKLGVDLKLKGESLADQLSFGKNLLQTILHDQ